jgi:succinate---hydroxymethylglutarate CoA-transferase
MVEEHQHPVCGPLKLIGTPVKYSRTQPNIRSPPPLLGQHTNEILTEFLGLKPAEIERLKDASVVV